MESRRQGYGGTVSKGMPSFPGKTRSGVVSLLPVNHQITAIPRVDCCHFQVSRPFSPILLPPATRKKEPRAGDSMPSAGEWQPYLEKPVGMVPTSPYLGNSSLKSPLVLVSYNYCKLPFSFGFTFPLAFIWRLGSQNCFSS